MDVIMEIARLLHSWTRWLLLIVTVIALVVFILGLVQKSAWTKRASSLLNAFGSLVGVQWLFGLILLISYGSLTTFSQRHFWEHLFVQTAAMLVANAHHAWRRKELPDSARYTRGLIVIVVTLILVIVGIFILPAGIQWRFYVPAGG